MVERLDLASMDLRIVDLPDCRMKGRSKKSVRHDASSDAIGPDIPLIPPEDERCDQCEEEEAL